MMVLAAHGKFDEILDRLLLSDEYPGTTSRLGSMFITNSDEAAFPLHAILRYRPPVEVVDGLISKLQVDCSTLAPGVLVPEESREATLHQTPLHIAVASQCSLPVIQRLLEGESLCMPSMTKDGLHRFPLHWACAMPHSARRWSLHRSADIDYRWDVIHLLLEQYPVAAVIPDVYNQTPLDYARHNRLHSSIIELVKQVAIDYERYSPVKRKLRITDSPLREHTEVTSVVSESEHVPVELPVLIESANKAAAAASPWVADDEVSSLGGDFSYYAPSSPTKEPVSQVTSLFSSALRLNQPASMRASVSPERSVVRAQANAVTRKATTTNFLLGKEVSSENSSDQVNLSPLAAETPTKSIPRTTRTTPIRAKTLLIGKMRVSQRHVHISQDTDDLSIALDAKFVSMAV